MIPPDLKALRALESNPNLTQRELAKQLGLSLGKTHYVLKALVDKGLVKVENFRRSDNKLGYAYLLTPRGLRAKARIMRRFLAAKRDEYKQLKKEIRELEEELQRAGEPPAETTEMAANNFEAMQKI